MKIEEKNTEVIFNIENILLNELKIISLLNFTCKILKLYFSLKIFFTKLKIFILKLLFKNWWNLFEQVLYVRK